MKKHKHKNRNNTFKCICKISNKTVSNTNKNMKCDTVINTNCVCFTNTFRTKLTLVYLFFTLWFFTTGCAWGTSLRGGHSDGDPAPGRSPGPPPANAVNNNVLSSSENDTNNNSEYIVEMSNFFMQFNKRETVNEPTWRNAGTEIQSRVEPADEADDADDESTLIMTVADSYEDDNGSGFDAPWCDDYSGFQHFNPGSPSHVAFNLTHQLYTTENGIYPGITYQGKIFTMTMRWGKRL